MDVSLLAEAPPAEATADWRRLAAPLGLGVLLLGLLFNREVVVAVQTWDSSTAYNHCFLVIPITLYLLWDRRQDLAGDQQVHQRGLPAAEVAAEHNPEAVGT